MLEFDFTEEESSLNISLDRMISGMLPHKNFEPKSVGLILESILTYIKLEELKLSYYVIISALMDYVEIGLVTPEFEPILNREELSLLLQSQVLDLVVLRDIGMKEFLRQEGLSEDLDNEIYRKEAANRLYEMTMDKYDDLMELSVSSKESLEQIPILKSSVLQQAGYNSLRTQRTVLDQGKWVKKKFYRGPEGWLTFIGFLHQELSTRLKGKGSGVFSLDSPSKASQALEDFMNLYEAMGTTGWTPYDNHLGFVKNRLSVIVGNESVGKTAISVSLAAQAINQGLKVMYMYTEGTYNETLARITTAYLNIKYGQFITTNHLAGKLALEDELKRLVKQVLLEFSEGTFLTLVEASTYDKLNTDLMNYHDMYDFDVIFLDHTGALRGSSGDTRKDISTLTTHVLEFKKARPVHVFPISHASYLSKELSSKGKSVRTSATRGSATLSEAADDVFFLVTDEDMEKQGVISNSVIKSRNGPKGASFLLDIKTEISTVTYNPKSQGLLGGATVDANEALREINRTYEDEYGDYEEDPKDNEDYEYELDTEY